MRMEASVMKAKAMQIVREAELIPVTERWNPLEHVVAAEYVPPVWIGVHVGTRLVQAFKTLASQPMPSVGNPGSAWPHYRFEWIDINAIELEWAANPFCESACDARQQWSKRRNRASATEISRMYEAISWPARYLNHRPKAARIVNAVARQRARDVETDVIARRLGETPWHLRQVNRSGLDDIAAGLRAGQVPVF